jgi:hypothetical protein
MFRLYSSHRRIFLFKKFNKYLQLQIGVRFYHLQKFSDLFTFVNIHLSP